MALESISWGQIKGDRTTIPLDSNRELIIEKNNTAVNLEIKGSESYIHRFIVGENDKLILSPIMPDLPVVIRTGTLLSIMPQKKLTAFVEVPLFLGIYSVNRGSKDLLYELPIKKLSKSFLGDSETGDLSYSLESPLYMDYKDYELNNRSVYCKFFITNKTSSIMNFERMILRVPNFSIYQGEEYFFSNIQKINYIGREVSNQMTIQKQAPSIPGLDLKQVSDARQGIDSNLLRKSFYFIKNIYNI